MPQQGTIYRVLIASPGDCKGEREMVPEVVYAWNAAHTKHSGAILEPVMWETHARPELGNRPQGIINDQLVEDCDLLIGTFWTRLGTSTGKAVSGTAEEIEQLRAAGKPVMLYFSAAPAVPDSIDPEQYAALKGYKKSLQQQGLYFQYDSVGDLRNLLTVHLAGSMAKLHAVAAKTARPLPEADGIAHVAISLGAEARQLLGLAVSSPRGDVVYSRSMHGTEVAAGEHIVMKSDDNREDARWKAGIEELLRAKLIEAKGDHFGDPWGNGIFRVTLRGYKVFDELNAINARLRKEKEKSAK